MLHLLKIEWLKIKNYRAFWVFAVLYLVSIFIVTYISWYIEQRTKAQVPEASMLLGDSFAFPKVWQTVGWLSSWLLYFPGMIIIMLMRPRGLWPSPEHGKAAVPQTRPHEHLDPVEQIPPETKGIMTAGK